MEDVWLAGKGPSLDAYDWSQAGPKRFCVNETVFVVPEPWAALALDRRVFDKFKVVPSTVTIYTRNAQYTTRLPKNYTPFQRDSIINCFNSTAVCAVQLLYSMGYRRIHFVGFDAIDGNPDYSDKVLGANGRGTSRDGYVRISNRLKSEIAKLGIEAIFEHRSLDIKRKFNDNGSIKGLPASQRKVDRVAWLHSHKRSVIKQKRDEARRIKVL